MPEMVVECPHLQSDCDTGARRCPGNPDRPCGLRETLLEGNVVVRDFRGVTEVLCWCGGTSLIESVRIR